MKLKFKCAYKTT